MKRDFSAWIGEAKGQTDRYDDPLELLGADISYDDFMDWLEIADDEADRGLESQKGLLERLVKYNHLQHAEIVRVKIKSIKRNL